MKQNKQNMQLIDKNYLITSVCQTNRNRKLFPHQNIAISVLQRIIDNSWDQILQRKILKKHLCNYSNQRSSLNYLEAIKMHFDKNKLNAKLSDENQPVALISDNLIPTNTNLQNKTISTQSEINRAGIIPVEISVQSSKTISKSKNSISKQNLNTIQNYIKLDSQNGFDRENNMENTNDPYIEQMRRIKQSTIKNQSTQSNKKTTLRDIINKDQKISFDFEGIVIQIKSNQKQNFNIKSVDTVLATGQHTKNSYQKHHLSSISSQVNRKDLLKKILPKRNTEIQFSNTISLTPEVNVCDGIKFIHNKAILEKKKKQSSLAELKRNVNHKKFSKIQFQRLKSLGNTKSILKTQSPSLPSIVKSQLNISNQNSIIGRSMSDVKLGYNTQRSHISNRMNTQLSQQRIFIQNQQLIQSLLENQPRKIQNHSKSNINNQNTIRQEEIALNFIDKANLNYMKTGSVGKLQFPKITYRIKQSNSKNSQQSFKQRQSNSKIIQKLKNTQNSVDKINKNLLLENKAYLKGKRKNSEFQKIKKHFQDKLRVDY